jgi:hypothetical protein
VPGRRDESALAGWGRPANIINFNDLRFTARLDAGLERLRKKCGEMVKGLQISAAKEEAMVWVVPKPRPMPPL